MHGGAFLIGSAQIYRYQSSLIAKRAGATVISVDYRLAPEHPFPAAPDDCLAAYRGLIDSGIDPHRVVLAGDSAGGNLALGVSQRMRDAGENLPAGLALISPWVDLTCSADSMDTNANPRHLAQRSGLLASARAYLNGEDPTTPLASPLHGDLSGLSPVLIQVGGSETLLDESVQLENALAQQGTSAQLQIFNGMVHEWHLLSALLDPDDELEGATKAIDDMADFIIGVAA
jgi:monoterpene epsilon-lactone hydrolase